MQTGCDLGANAEHATSTSQQCKQVNIRKAFRWLFAETTRVTPETDGRAGGEAGCSSQAGSLCGRPHLHRCYWL